MQSNKKKGQKQDQAQGYMAQRRFILSKNSNFYVQEAYKTLRANMRFFLEGGRCGMFCITSGAPGEGKSITALNLAISFAQTGKRVLLIDGDMRRPSLSRLLIEKASPGLSNVLVGLATEEEAIRQEVYPNLDVVFSGDIPPNPSELLESPRMEMFIERMGKAYDCILMDTPPVNVVSDACVVANLLDGALFLVRGNKTDKASVARGVNQLKLSGAKILGFILNGIEPDTGKYGSYYQYAEPKPKTRGGKT